MMQNVWTWLVSNRLILLVIVGWLSFVTGNFIGPLWLKLTLLTAARVLP